MSGEERTIGSEGLQFDHVITGSASAPPSTLAVTCVACQTPIETEYYDVNGHTVCGRCRTALESAGETPRGFIPFIAAAAFGLGAGIVGAAIYYAVMAIANLEIGIVAILIGYMVGYAVRRGAGQRGGRRFQVLAVALTYISVALAYTPVAVSQALAADRNNPKVSTGTNSSESAAVAPPSAGRLLLGLLFVSAMIVALPVLVVVGSFPSGLISAFIIFIGMKQAWRMTAAAAVQILGPFRVGAALSSTA
jgi:hypothetical protein